MVAATGMGISKWTVPYPPCSPSAEIASHAVLNRANAGARSARLAARVHQLEERLAKALGEEIRGASGLGPPADVAELGNSITRLERPRGMFVRVSTGVTLT